MVQKNPQELAYFVFGFPLSDKAWRSFAVRSVLPDDLSAGLPDPSYEIRMLADKINRLPTTEPLPKDLALAAGHDGLRVHAEILLALRTINEALRWVSYEYFLSENPGCLDRCRQWAGQRLGADVVANVYQVFAELFPPLTVQLARRTTREFLADTSGTVSGFDEATLEMVLLFMNSINPAVGRLTALFNDDELRRRASFIPFVTGLEDYLEEFEPAGSSGSSLFHLLRAPMLASPDSLAGQIEYIRRNWAHLLPPELMARLQTALDVLKEVDVTRLPDYGPPPVLEFGPGSAAWGLDEPEAYSRDADWMSNVVLMAKSTYVWLDQLSRWYGRPLRTLADIPDEELDKLARWGVTGLWLIGLWERSDASRRIKQYMGNPEAAASAYALRAYDVAADLGGREAYDNLRERAGRRGIRLASDMVPNHMGIDSDWVINHPDWFLQLDRPPYPAYSFTGGDLCEHPHVAIRIEDGYWNHSDAAVVFQRVDERYGDVRYIYHGNDGTSMPWNDTAQLNFLLPEVREAVVQVILHVARMFPIIRFDAAMTLAKKHYQRLWFPAPGDAGAIPSRAEHGLSKPDFDQVFPVEFWREVVDRVAAEAPDTLLLAEAFWLMEGYFVRTLGMHRVYNSAFMNMLKMEDNQKYRQTIKNVLEFSPQILKRFVNFMNNPDERTAVEQFGRGDKYFGCATLLVTMPGLPMLGHGQIEGFSEKYGMEYRRAYWDEHVDDGMVHRHEREIFPLMRRRHLFSGAEHFALFDFETDGGWIDENVFAYTNRHGGDRGLVLYNNAYESTSGRITLSSAINTGSADAPTLVRRTVAEALDLRADRWYVFRDHAKGLEYLKSGQEMVNGGFHTQLHGYEYRALVDFRELEDTDGSWRRLAESLAGHGVPDMAQARRRLSVAPALTRIAELSRPEILARLESALDEQAETAAIAQNEPEHTLLERLGGSRALQTVLLRCILSRLPGIAEQRESLALAGVELLPGDLDLVLQDMQRHLDDWLGHAFAAGTAAHLARLLAESEPVVAALRTAAQSPTVETDAQAWFAEALDRPELQAFLGYNDYAGVTYLNREALDFYLDSLLVSALVDEGLLFTELTTDLDDLVPPTADAPPETETTRDETEPAADQDDPDNLDDLDDQDPAQTPPAPEALVKPAGSLTALLDVIDRIRQEAEAAGFVVERFRAQVLDVERDESPE